VARIANSTGFTETASSDFQLFHCKLLPGSTAVRLLRDEII